MISPREQAIEEIQNLYDRIPTIRGAVRSIITDYERTRARLDGAKMMPRDATEEQMAAASKAFMGDINCNYDGIWRAMHDATPKEG